MCLRAALIITSFVRPMEKFVFLREFSATLIDKKLFHTSTCPLLVRLLFLFFVLFSIFLYAAVSSTVILMR